MSFHIDTKTMLFDDLSDQEADDLLIEVTKLVLDGTSVYDTTAFKTWCNTFGYGDREALLVMATAYPQRVLLSLLKRKK